MARGLSFVFFLTASIARAQDLASAAGLTDVQAEAVFRQLLHEPAAPRFRSVVTDTLADGTRNVFALMDLDLAAECREPPSPFCAPGTRTYVFFTQIDADGRVVRTNIERPFTIADPALAPVALRTFAPRPGAARIVLVDGFTRQPFQHDVYVWDGRRGLMFPVGRSDGRRAVTVGTVRIVDDALVLASLECTGGCRCALPSSVEAAARAIERPPRGCTVTERPLEMPATIRLDDEDLDALAPARSIEEARAARAADLARAWGLTPEQAGAVLERERTFPSAPQLTRFVSYRTPAGARIVYGVVQQRDIDVCIEEHGEGRTIYDAVRACADRGAHVQSYGLYVRIAPDRRVAETAMSFLGSEPVVAIYLLPDPVMGAEAVFELAAARELATGAMFLHSLAFMRGGAGARVHPFARGTVNEILSRSSDPPFVTLSVRRLTCSSECPCDPIPTSVRQARASIAARATCNVETLPLEAP